MKIFTVTVCRTVHQVRELIIPAKSRKEAKEAALELAPNKDFTGLEKESEYKVMEICERGKEEDRYGGEDRNCVECGNPPDECICVHRPGQ